MKYTLENSKIKIVVNSFGAELDNIQDIETKKEYMWQKDKNFWGKSSPILFPFVGMLKDSKYKYNNKEYAFDKRHGFARDYDFVLSDKGEDFLEFLFESTEETFEIYPFNFKFYITYKIKENNLEVNYKVENISDETMYFSLGAHPAFSVPKDENYYIEFEKEEKQHSKLLKDGLVDGEFPYELIENKKLLLTSTTFINDAIIFENTNSKKLWIKNNKNDTILEFEYVGFRYIAFWNSPGADFVCLEPWDGITDYNTSDNNLENKIGIEKLNINETYSKSINIKMF